LLKKSSRNLITAHAVSSETIVMVFPLAQAFTPGLVKSRKFFSPIYALLPDVSCPVSKLFFQESLA
jgi:hypothetical protein